MAPISLHHVLGVATEVDQPIVSVLYCCFNDQVLDRIAALNFFIEEVRPAGILARTFVGFKSLGTGGWKGEKFLYCKEI